VEVDPKNKNVCWIGVKSQSESFLLWSELLCQFVNLYGCHGGDSLITLIVVPLILVSWSSLMPWSVYSSFCSFVVLFFNIWKGEKIEMWTQKSGVGRTNSSYLQFLKWWGWKMFTINALNKKLILHSVLIIRKYSFFRYIQSLMYLKSESFLIIRSIGSNSSCIMCKFE
jgi:hypothetical protein